MQQNGRVYIQTQKILTLTCNTSQYKKIFLISKPSCLQNAWGKKDITFSGEKTSTSSYNPEDAQKSNHCEKQTESIFSTAIYANINPAAPHSLVKHLLYQTYLAPPQTPGNDIQKTISGSPTSWKPILLGWGDSFLNGSTCWTGSARVLQKWYNRRVRAGRAGPQQLRPNLL